MKKILEFFVLRIPLGFLKEVQPTIEETIHGRFSKRVLKESLKQILKESLEDFLKESLDEYEKIPGAFS